MDKIAPALIAAIATIVSALIAAHAKQAPASARSSRRAPVAGVLAVIFAVTTVVLAVAYFRDKWAPRPRPITEDTPLSITEDTPLSKELEIGEHTFQTLKYQAIVTQQGTVFSRGLYLDSQNVSPSVVTYTIPKGAAKFSAVLAARNVACGSSGPEVNGWSVTISAPGIAPQSYSFNHQSADQLVEIPFVAPVPNELTISVNPHGDRTCDHSAIADPHYEPARS